MLRRRLCYLIKEFFSTTTKCPNKLDLNTLIFLTRKLIRAQKSSADPVKFKANDDNSVKLNTNDEIPVEFKANDDKSVEFNENDENLVKLNTNDEIPQIFNENEMKSNVIDLKPDNSTSLKGDCMTKLLD